MGTILFIVCARTRVRYFTVSIITLHKCKLHMGKGYGTQHCRLLFLEIIWYCYEDFRTSPYHPFHRGDELAVNVTKSTTRPIIPMYPTSIPDVVRTWEWMEEGVWSIGWLFPSVIHVILVVLGRRSIIPGILRTVDEGMCFTRYDNADNQPEQPTQANNPHYHGPSRGVYDSISWYGMSFLIWMSEKKERNFDLSRTFFRFFQRVSKVEKKQRSIPLPYSLGRGRSWEEGKNRYSGDHIRKETMPR